MPNPTSLTLPIEGMTCASCATRVEKALSKVPGVSSASVNLATERVAVELSAPVAPGVLSAAVLKAGYGVPSQTVALHIEGMTCASCVGRVEKALRAVPGVLEASVNLAIEQAEVRVVSLGAPEQDLIRAVRRAGYEAQPIAGSAPAPRRREPGWKVLLAAALSVPLVLPMLGGLFGAHWMLPAWVQ